MRGGAWLPAPGCRRRAPTHCTGPRHRHGAVVARLSSSQASPRSSAALAVGSRSAAPVSIRACTASAVTPDRNASCAPGTGAKMLRSFVRRADPHEPFVFWLLSRNRTPRSTARSMAAALGGAGVSARAGAGARQQNAEHSNSPRTLSLHFSPFLHIVKLGYAKEVPMQAGDRSRMGTVHGTRPGRDSSEALHRRLLGLRE